MMTDTLTRNETTRAPLTRPRVWPTLDERIDMAKRTGQTCSIDGCESRTHGRGLCSMHYLRWKRHGDPEMVTRHYTRQPPNFCTIEGCDEPVHGRTWCSMHYQRWTRYGDPLIVMRVYGDDEARFWSKVTMDGPIAPNRPDLGRCWMFSGKPHNSGHAVMGMWNPDGATRAEKRSIKTAYRYAYELLIGPIPEGLVLDHFACDNGNIGCVNPYHCEPVTRAENSRRAWRSHRNERNTP